MKALSAAFFLAAMMFHTPVAFAENGVSLRAGAAISRAPIERRGSEYPSGVWITEDLREKVLRISRRGHVETNIQVVTATGVAAPLKFPGRLRERGRGRYTARGTVTLSWLTGLGVRNCEYEVRLDLREYNDALEAELTYPATMGVDAFGRCIQIGQQNQYLEFYRDR